MLLRKLMLVVGICVEVRVINIYESLDGVSAAVLVGVGAALIAEALLEKED